MKRTSVNPIDWSLAYSMDQGEIVEGATRQLGCSGRIPVDPAPDTDPGIAVVAPNDLRGQMEHSFRIIDFVLEKAEMGRENIVSLGFFTTDIDGFLANYDVYAEWIAPAGARPPQSLIGVNRLVLPELMVEIEIEAAA